MSTPDGEHEDREPPATRVVVSYPADLSEWGRETVEGSPFRAYLRKTLGRVASPERRGADRVAGGGRGQGR
jgi:hypothetical protein